MSSAWSGRGQVPELAIWLAVAALAAVFGRIGLTIGELRRSNEQFSQAWIAGLTGFDDREPSVEAPAPTAVPAGATSVWQIASAAIAVTALIGVGVLLWQVASDSSENGETLQSDVTRPEVEVVDSDLENEVDALGENLRTAGLSGVEPELRGSVVYLTGSVADETERQALVEVVDGLSGSFDIDSSEVVVGGSSESPGAGSAAQQPAGDRRVERRPPTMALPS